MADNPSLPVVAGAGVSAAADEIGSGTKIYAQRVKIDSKGVDGQFTDASVANPLPVGIRASSAGDTGVTVGTSSVSVIAAHGFRLGLEITNDSTDPAAVIYLGFDGTANIGTGIMLAPNGGSWDGNHSDTLWMGAVTAICAIAGGHLAVSEATT